MFEILGILGGEILYAATLFFTGWVLGSFFGEKK